jgi:hypothetical protein
LLRFCDGFVLCLVELAVLDAVLESDELVNTVRQERPALTMEDFKVSDGGVMGE